MSSILFFFISKVENSLKSSNFIAIPVFWDLYAANIIFTASSPAIPFTSGSLFSSKASKKSLYKASCP